MYIRTVIIFLKCNRLLRGAEKLAYPPTGFTSALQGMKRKVKVAFLVSVTFTLTESHASLSNVQLL